MVNPSLKPPFQLFNGILKFKSKIYIGVDAEDIAGSGVNHCVKMLENSRQSEEGKNILRDYLEESVK